MSNHAAARQINSSTLDPQPADLVFIQIKRPNDTKKKDVRKQVRSHIAKQQHKRAKDLLQQRLGSRAFSPLAPREADRLRDPDTHVFDFTDGGTHSSNASRTNPVYQDDNNPIVDQDDAANLEALMTMRLVAQNPLAKAFSQGTAAFQTFALHDPANTAGIALANLGLNTSSVVGFYDHLVLNQAGDIQTQFKTGLKASAAHKRFMTFIFSDPMLLIMAILVSIANILGDLSATSSHSHVLQLYSLLVQSVNTALNDSERSVSDEMLVCISLFAAYEIKHGTRENYHMHMRGLIKMISLRGGLKAIGAQKPWVERLLSWHDVNSAEIARCKPYCRGLERAPELEHGAPNIKVYTAKDFR